MDIEKALSDIPFYQIHPEYKPFIGENFDKYQILLVGESHYIGQTPDNELFSLEYLLERVYT